MQALRDADMTVDMIREELTQVYDVERLLSRIAYKTINAKDCLALRDSLAHVPAIHDALASIAPNGMLRSLLDHLTPLGDVVDKLTQAIDVDAPR